MKGQVSTEMLVIVGLMLLLLTPLLIYAYGRSNVAQEDLAVQKAEFAVQRLASAADSVGYLGGAAAVVEEIEIPPYVKSVYLSNNGHDIVFDMEVSGGKKQIVKSSAFVIDGPGFSRVGKEGTYFFEVKALSDYSNSSGAAQVRITVR